MRGYQCDNYKEKFIDREPSIELHGYHPPNLGGILIPKNLHHTTFCCTACFVYWIKNALTKEKRA